MTYPYYTSKKYFTSSQSARNDTHVCKVRTRGTALVLVEVLLLPRLSMFLCSVWDIQSPEGFRLNGVSISMLDSYRDVAAQRP